MNLQMKHAPIDRNIVSELIESTPETWNAIELLVERSTEQGNEKLSVEISSPDGETDPVMPTDEIFELLKKYNRALCIAETEERVTPDVVTADFNYYRYRKPTYTGEERAAMVQRMREHIDAGRNVFAYFKHEETPQGALYAVDVLKQFTST